MKVQINAAVYTDKSAITQNVQKQTVAFFGSLFKGNDAASGKLWPGPSSTPSLRGCFKTLPCNCRMGWSRTRSASRLRRASPLTHSLTKFATFHDDQFASVMCFFSLPHVSPKTSHCIQYKKCLLMKTNVFCSSRFLNPMSRTIINKPAWGETSFELSADFRTLPLERALPACKHHWCRFTDILFTNNITLFENEKFHSRAILKCNQNTTFCNGF